MYDAVKDAILSGGQMQEGVPLHLASAMLAGLSATLVASPVDVIKTRCGDDDVMMVVKVVVMTSLTPQVHERHSRRVQGSSPLRQDNSDSRGTRGLLQRIRRQLPEAGQLERGPVADLRADQAAHSSLDLLGL